MRRRAAGLIATLTAVLMVAGCAPSRSVDAAPQAPAYDGPLVVEITAPPSDQDADRSGAAGRVVDCDGPHVGDSAVSPYDNEVTRTEAGALAKTLREEPHGATDGYVKVREETDRVLYTYTDGGRVRQAYVLHRGPTIDHHNGWYVESWARCDWSELPDRWAAARGLQLWTGPDGRRVPSTTIQSHAGPEHCDWQDMTFLSLDGGSLDGGRTFVAHPDAELYPDWFSVRYAEGQPLPADAHDTGWERNGRHLWLAADDSRAYVGTREAVDVWPGEVQALGCA